MVAESWLRSPDGDKYAAAMSRCQHGGGFCSADGYCHRGTCFTSSQEERRIKQLEAELKALRAQLPPKRATP